MVDGEHVLPLATSQDHKRLLDGDQGPNTGGMGAYSPAPVVTPRLHARVMREVIEPTDRRAWRRKGIRYTGFLYAGLMIAAEGTPKVLEFNCRMGDPETQPIMMRLKSDLVDPGGARRQRHARPGRGGMGPPRRAGRGAGRRRLPRRAAQGRRRSPACRKPRSATTCTCSMPAPPCRTARSSPAAAACCASPRWATACAGAEARLRALPADPLRRLQMRPRHRLARA